MKNRIVSILALFMLTFVMSACELYEPLEMNYPHYGDGGHEGHSGDSGHEGHRGDGGDD